MRDLTPEETRQFLLGTARTAMMATVRANGRPHVAPIWIDMEGDDIIFTTWHDSVKGTNIARDPHVSLGIDDSNPPYAYVLIEGTVSEIKVTEEERVAWATRIARRYMGDALADTFGRRNGVPGELVMRLTPEKIIAKTGIAD